MKNIINWFRLKIGRQPSPAKPIISTNKVEEIIFKKFLENSLVMLSEGYELVDMKMRQESGFTVYTAIFKPEYRMEFK